MSNGEELIHNIYQNTIILSQSVVKCEDCSKALIILCGILFKSLFKINTVLIFFFLFSTVLLFQHMIPEKPTSIGHYIFYHVAVTAEIKAMDSYKHSSESVSDVNIPNRYMKILYQMGISAKDKNCQSIYKKVKKYLSLN